MQFLRKIYLKHRYVGFNHIVSEDKRVPEYSINPKMT
jgi:hypothetical protein